MQLQSSVNHYIKKCTINASTHFVRHLVKFKFIIQVYNQYQPTYQSQVCPKTNSTIYPNKYYSLYSSITNMSKYQSTTYSYKYYLIYSWITSIYKDQSPGYSHKYCQSYRDYALFQHS